MSFKTLFKIEFLPPGTGNERVLGIIPGVFCYTFFSPLQANIPSFPHILCFPFSLPFFMFSLKQPRKCLEEGVPKNHAKFTGKHVCQSVLLNKVVGLSLQLY